MRAPATAPPSSDALALSEQAAGSPPESSSLAVVVLHYRTLAETERCVQSLVLGSARPFRLVVVDNDPDRAAFAALADRVRAASGAGAVAEFAAPPTTEQLLALTGCCPSVLVMRSGRNGGYAFGNNLGIRASLALGADLVTIINSDAEVSAGFDDQIRRRFDADPRLGVLGARVVNPDGSLQSLGGRLERWKTVARSAHTAGRGGSRAIDYVPGCFLAIHRRVLESCGLLPEEYFLYFEDVDYCQRARRAGWGLDVEEEIEVVHAEGTSSGGRVNAFRVFWCERGKVIFNAKRRPWCLPWHCAYVLARAAALLTRPRRRFEALPLLKGATSGLAWCAGWRRSPAP